MDKNTGKKPFASCSIDLEDYSKHLESWESIINGEIKEICCFKEKLH